MNLPVQLLDEPVSVVEDSTKAVLVDHGYHYLPIVPATPRGKKLILINRDAGVATFGELAADPGFWTHYSPLPTFKD